MTDPLDIRDQEHRREIEQDKARQAQRLEVEDFKWLMSHKQGRRFMWRLLERTGVFRSSFRLNNEMAFLEGQRNVGLVQIAMLHEHCPNAYLQMLKEQGNG